MTVPAADPAGVVYEVNLEVDAAVGPAFRAWLESHAAQICTLPGFTGARRFEVLDPPPPPDRIGLCVQYTLASPAALEAYLHEHAPRMRADGQARFGGRFTASRRVLVGLA